MREGESMTLVTFVDSILSNLIRRCWHDDQGGTVAENGLMFAGGALAITGLLFAAGGDFSRIFNLLFGG